MVNAINVVMHAKDYGSSQSNLGKEHVRSAQNYSIIKDLGQTPCAMSTLEVLHTFSSWRNALLSALGFSDDSSSSMIKFETLGIQPCLSYYMSLLIHVECLNNTIMHTVIVRRRCHFRDVFGLF